MKKTVTQYGMLGVLEILLKYLSRSVKSSYSSGPVSTASCLSIHPSTLTLAYEKHLVGKKALAKSFLHLLLIFVI